MNATKVMLKAVVLTALMQAVQQQRREPTREERIVVDSFNEELMVLEATGAVLDRPLDEVYLDLLAAIDTLEEVL